MGHTIIKIPVSAADRFGRDVALLLRIYRALQLGSKQLRIKQMQNTQAKNLVSALLQHSDNISHYIGAMLDRAPEYVQVQMSVQEFLAENRELMKLIFELQKKNYLTCDIYLK